MNSKALFLQNKDLAGQLSAVTSANWFSQCLLHVRGTLMERNLTSDELNGAKLYENALMTMADSQYEAPEPLKCGINHNVDNPRVEKTKTKS